MNSQGDHDPPGINSDNKMHGPLPKTLDPNWSMDQLEDLANDLQESINTRQNEMNQFGDNGDLSHGQRIGQEQDLLSQVLSKLGR
jgi:hypothetical protein